MTALLVLMAFLLVFSGAVKLKAAERVQLGLPLLALLEMVAGVLLMGGVFFRPPDAGQGLTILLGGTALVIVSSLQVGMAVRRRQRLRTASEGSRLTNYVRYLSSQDPPPGDPGPPDQEPGARRPPRS